jgi:hypothetical protein
MTAGKPQVPAKLREALGALAELSHTENLPPCRDAADYEKRNQVQNDRRVALEVWVSMLYEGLDSDLITLCSVITKVAREELAKPLGYEPDKVPAK